MAVCLCRLITCDTCTALMDGVRDGILGAGCAETLCYLHNCSVNPNILK